MKDRLILFWNQQSVVARIGLVVLGFAIVAGTVAAAVWAIRADYQPLFTDLDPRDASVIAAELDRTKIPYEIAADGTTILVEKSHVPATRMKVMGKGLDLKGSVGFEIFNNTDFGMTEFAQKINYQRALQGELARTISAFDEVRSVRVHLVLPESGLLRKNTVRPKASVTLAMRNGDRLTLEQIQGIQRLVAASVPEMEPAAVTVVDQQGVALSRRSNTESDRDLGTAGLDAKRDVESYLTHKVVAVLDQAYGVGKALVTVDVTLSHDHIKSTREDVLPVGGREGAIVRRRDTTQRAPITVTAVDGAREPGLGSTAVASDVEYVHGRQVEQIVSEPGAVKRISVGILVPGTGDSYQAERLKQVVANAVGLNPSRGDAIAFSWIGSNGKKLSGDGLTTLPQSPVAGRQKPAEAIDADARVMHLLWIAVAALFILLLVALYLVRRRSQINQTPASLSSREREEILARVKAWMEGGGRAARNGTGV